jgi:hypothetical protein
MSLWVRPQPNGASLKPSPRRLIVAPAAGRHPGESRGGVQLNKDLFFVLDSRFRRNDELEILLFSTSDSLKEAPLG